jgi:hypothetical protein
MSASERRPPNAGMAFLPLVTWSRQGARQTPRACCCRDSSKHLDHSPFQIFAIYKDSGKGGCGRTPQLDGDGVGGRRASYLGDDGRLLEAAGEELLDGRLLEGVVGNDGVLAAGVARGAVGVEHLLRGVGCQSSRAALRGQGGNRPRCVSSSCISRGYPASYEISQWAVRKS